MSLNQSRSEKSDSQFRKPGGGRFGNSSGGQQRNFGGGRGRGGAGPPTSSHPAAAPSARSYKKANNAQGGQSRVNLANVNTSDHNTATASRSVENGGVHSSLHGVPSTPALAPIPKSTDASSQKSGRPLPRAPSSQPPSTSSDSTLPSTPAKGGEGKGFPLQFGSISPTFMNGMQVPPRTTSAPPNLDEQKRDQAQRDAQRALPAAPLPSALKQDVSKKDVALVEKAVVKETKTDSKAKRDVQVTSASPLTQAQKPPAVPITGISLPLSFHQQTVPMQFGGPIPQMQSQGIQTSALQTPMQMPLQMGNPSQVPPQQVFVSGLQHHYMQPQGLLHHGQNLGFNPQIAQQLPHQLGNVGMNIPSQFNQQSASKFGSARKTVKITHPETREELRLDGRDGGSSVSRSQHSVPLQNQPLPTYTATHPMGYYSNSYTSGPNFFPLQSSLPLTSTQLNSSSQGPRFNHPINQSQSNKSFGNHSTSVDYTRDGQHMVPPSQPISIPVTIRAAGEKAVKSTGSEKTETAKLLYPAAESGVDSLSSKVGTECSSQSAPIPASISATSAALPNINAKDIASISTPIDAIEKGTPLQSTSCGEIKKQPLKDDNLQPPKQVDGQSDSTMRQEVSNSLKITASETPEALIVSSSVALKKDVTEATDVPTTVSDEASGAAPGVDVGVGSCSHFSESSETPNITNTLAKEHVRGSDPPSLETIPREFPISEDSGVAESGEQQSDNSLEGSNAVSECPQAVNLEKSGGAVEDSDRKFDYASSVSEDNSTRGKISSLDYSSSTDSLSGKGDSFSKPTLSDKKVASASANMDSSSGHEKDFLENSRPSSSSGSNKASMESNKIKNKGKKKLKELLQKADALGTTADLYMAYKGPQEKKDVATELPSEICGTEVSADAKKVESISENMDEQSKNELDDWEDAADLSTPKLVSTGNDEEEFTAKKYSRDFLLTFSEQCMDLPEGFEITSDIADAIMRVSVTVPRNDREYPSPGRAIDRPAGSTRSDRRGSVAMDSTERWKQQPGPFTTAQDPKMDLAYGSNAMGFAAGRGPIHGVLRNPRAQVPVQLTGGILSGPMHSVGYQGLQRNNSDADRWLRATNFNKGLMPVPQTPVPVMHKAERKYEVGKVTDEEMAKQRKLKGILNKLTPQNFERLFEQVKEVNIDNVTTLNGVISQIFDKALTEPTFCEMYASFCQHLACELPDLSVDNEKITFKRLLLNKCQEEFERGEREEQEANNNDGEGDTELSEAEREEKRLKVRRRMLGNIRLIGELYKKRMLTQRIMHECIKKLLGQFQNPNEENIEALCKLMSTIGEMIDHPEAKEFMDDYFDIMGQLSNNMKLSSRVRFMLRDSIDLRKNKWQQRRKVEGPKKIEEVHRDAAQERQGQVGRLNRGPSMNTGMRRGQPLDFGPRGSMLPSPMGAGGGFRGMTPQVRGFGGQDPRMDERNIFDGRTLSVPLPQRSSADESITLGPQGGLARGMAFRGQPSVSGSPLLDNSLPFGDPRRIAGGGLNGYSAPPERPVYSSREEHFMRNASDRFSASVAYDQSSSQELSASHTNRDFRHTDRNLDRPRPMTSPVSRAGVSLVQNNSTENAWPEERLRDMSMAAIKEYYSARDEKEVALCIKDLNAPSFYPTVVSIWVSDSFERKDMERELLAKLLVNLTKPRDGTFSPTQLIQGFESVLTNLEDTVTDAPRAPEFLGRIFGKSVLENVLSLKDLGPLIQHGGEKPGSLLEAGLAAEILASLLETIRSEKGESTLNEIRASSNLKLEDFRPPNSNRCRKLEKFM